MLSVGPQRRDGFYMLRDLLVVALRELDMNTVTMQDEVRKLIESAREVGRRVERLEYSGNAVRMTVLSTEAKESPAGPEVPGRVAVYRALDGALVKKPVGVPLERSYHYVQASEEELKCTCDFAMVEASKANAYLKALARQGRVELREDMPMVRFTLDKHTVYALARGLEDGVIRDTPALHETLKLGLIALAVAKNIRLSPAAQRYLLERYAASR